MMPVGLRRLGLVVHVGASVGWLGAVAAFLAIAVAGLVSDDGQTVRAAYISADMVTSLAIVPLSVLALASGIVQSLGTRWGLFRNYWVIAKLFLTVVATGVLLLHTQPIAYLADVAASGVPGSPLTDVKVQLVVDAAGGVLVLILITAISVFKPRGMTPYGQRKQRERRTGLTTKAR